METCNNIRAKEGLPDRTKRYAQFLASKLAPDDADIEKVALGDTRRKSTARLPSAQRKKLAADAKAHEDPITMLEYFKETVRENAQIKNKVKLRRFALVDLLEGIEDATGPESGNFDVAAGGVDARVKITFNMVVTR